MQRVRKRDVATGPRKKVKTNADVHKSDQESEILLLESKIIESRKYYNNIAILVDYTREIDVENEKDVFAAVALCRVFSKLLAAGNLTQKKDSTESESTVVRWLTERLGDFYKNLSQRLRDDDVSHKSIALGLMMRLFKEKAKHLNPSSQQTWSGKMFTTLIQALVNSSAGETIASMFVEQYVKKYDDVRYHLFARVGDIFLGRRSANQVQNALHLLAALKPLPEGTERSPNYFLSLQAKTQTPHELYSHNAYMKQAQRAWMGIVRQKLTKAQRKRILESISGHIAPWFLKVELLMDFLTDSFNIGGSTSLMALSGLFYLIQEKNLDYPQFYQKLYSLLDGNLLHSKHRSRFFRMLDTFLGSTHLPATLVASFIKRLSRLCLYAPPSGIIVVVPWIYNLLKSHPACAFMIHRTADLAEKDEQGWGDPFCMEESDPMETDAIESSLWEIETLQSHYHPNVATIAKIISEQFTKHSYNIEDFLDHSYATMLETELSKDVKRPPEVEYEIPKKIFTTYDADCGKEDNALTRLWDFN